MLAEIKSTHIEPDMPKAMTLNKTSGGEASSPYASIKTFEIWTPFVNIIPSSIMHAGLRSI